jgi:hypothetical protein
VGKTGEPAQAGPGYPGTWRSGHWSLP